MSEEQLRAEQAVASVLSGERERYDHTTATIGDGAGNINVPSRPGWIYIRLHGDSTAVTQARVLTSVPLVEDLAIDVKRVRRGAFNYYQVEGVSVSVVYSQDPFWSSGISGFVGNHGPQHIRRDRGVGGPDPLDIYMRALVPLRAQAQGNMTVYVTPGYYYVHGFHYFAGASSPTFSAVSPFSPFSVDSRFDLLYLDANGALQIAQGTTATLSATPTFPTLPQDVIPIAFVFIDSTMSVITEQDIVDARVILSAATTPAGGNAPADEPYLVWRETENLPNSKTMADHLAFLENEFDLQMTLHLMGHI